MAKVDGGSHYFATPEASPHPLSHTSAARSSAPTAWFVYYPQASSSSQFQFCSLHIRRSLYSFVLSVPFRCASITLFVSLVLCVCFCNGIWPCLWFDAALRYVSRGPLLDNDMRANLAPSVESFPTFVHLIFKMQTSIVALLALAAGAIAQAAEKPAILNTEFAVKEGEDFTLKLKGCDDGCTISVQAGPDEKSKKDVKTLTSNYAGSAYDVLIKDLPSGNYNFHVINNKSKLDNYSVVFQYTGTAASSSAESSSAASTSSAPSSSSTSSSSASTTSSGSSSMVTSTSTQKTSASKSMLFVALPS